MSSNAYKDKVERAAAQVERAEILLRQLPQKTYKEHKTEILNLTRSLEKIAKDIRTKLAERGEQINA